jgi:hypothetical protein
VLLYRLAKTVAAGLTIIYFERVEGDSAPPEARLVEVDAASVESVEDAASLLRRGPGALTGV